MKVRLIFAVASVITVLALVTGAVSYVSFKKPPILLAEGRRNAEITVFADQVIGPLPDDFFGHNFHLHQNRFWDKRTGVIYPSTASMIEQLRPGNFRWPGGLQAREITWAHSIGPMSIRENMPSWISQTDKVVFGIDELVREGRRFNRQVGFTVSVNSERSAAEAADLVEYTNGQAVNCDNTNPNAWMRGAANSSGYQAGSMPTGYYACLRAHPDYGNSTAPYNIKYWEIGNEDYLPIGPFPAKTAEEYVAVVQNFTSAMRSKDASIKIGAVLMPGATAPWNNTVIDGTRNIVDFFILHGYSGGGLKSATLGYNMEIAVPIEITQSGHYTFLLTAWGSRGDNNNPNNSCPWPNMRVRLNGQGEQNFTVSAPENQPQVYSYAAGDLVSGSHTLQVALTNDCWQPQNGGDTNLYITKVERQQGGGPTVQIELIEPDDFARVQVEHANRFVNEMLNVVKTGLNLPANAALPVLATEFNTAFTITAGLPTEADLNRGMLGALFNASYLGHLINRRVLGSHIWELQELCGHCRYDLLYYDGDTPGQWKQAVGTPYGTATYWLYRQLADTGPRTLVKSSVVSETFRAREYLAPNWLTWDTPYVQAWATKVGDNAIRLHVVYSGSEELNLRLKIRGFPVAAELDVAQLRHRDLAAHNNAEEKELIVSRSTRLTGGQDTVYVVAPLSITSFSFYKSGTPPPPPGGGGGSIYSGGHGIGSGAKPNSRATTRAPASVGEQPGEAVPNLPELLPEEDVQVLAQPRRLTDNPWLWPVVTGLLAIMALCFWITGLWQKLHQPPGTVNVRA